MRNINTAIYQKIQQLIQEKREGDYWDYKQTWYADNERLLHDILCFANTIHDHDCYIILGVSDDGNIVGLTPDSPKRKKQADIIDLLYNTVFEGDNVPKVSLETIEIGGKEIDVLTIYDSFDVPYYLKKKPEKYKSIVPGFIYSRVGDKNTAIDKNSCIRQVEMLWKKRLGLLSPPIRQIMLNLRNKAEWAQVENTYFFISNPDFKIEESCDREDSIYGNKVEFYSYNQGNIRTQFIDFKIICRQTVLQIVETVILDSGRYHTPVPAWGFIHNTQRHNDIQYAYKYILMDSFEYALQQFLFDKNNKEADAAKRRFDEVVLYFENQSEQQSFNDFIEQDLSVLKNYIADAQLRTYIIESNDQTEIDNAKKRLLTAFAMKSFLSDWRRSNSGIPVKRIVSMELTTKALSSKNDTEIIAHRLTINGIGRVSHSIYTKSSKKAKVHSVYSSNKYLTRVFLNDLEPISTAWDTNYMVDGNTEAEWACVIKYTDGSQKRIIGNIAPPHSKSIIRKVTGLVRYKVKPWIFDPFARETNFI